MTNARDLLNLVRDPFFNWNEAYTQSMIPEEGTRIKKGRWVEEEYEVIYERDEDGDIIEWKYRKVKPEKVINYGGTD